MFKNKIKNKSNKKQAQYIVEFALVMPFFFIILLMFLPKAIDIYMNFRFSYVFTNAVIDTINNQPIYEKKEDAIEYSFTDELRNRLTGWEVSPYVIMTDQTAYVVGTITKRHIVPFGIKGKSYFDVIVPVNKAYIEPTILDINGSDLENNFSTYYGNATVQNSAHGSMSTPMFEKEQNFLSIDEQSSSDSNNDENGSKNQDNSIGMPIQGDINIFKGGF